MNIFNSIEDRKLTQHEALELLQRTNFKLARNIAPYLEEMGMTRSEFAIITETPDQTLYNAIEIAREKPGRKVIKGAPARMKKNMRNFIKDEAYNLIRAQANKAVPAKTSHTNGNDLISDIDFMDLEEHIVIGPEMVGIQMDQKVRGIVTYGVALLLESGTSIISILDEVLEAQHRAGKITRKCLRSQQLMFTHTFEK